ncbi:MAG: hypothetical protein PF692_04875 [Kiritimatiellae bacterium]|nr:hypothetical protein [Kiritimatiellia bacterium]
MPDSGRSNLSGGELSQGGQPLKDAAVGGLVGDFIHTAVIEPGRSYISFTGKPTGANGTYLSLDTLQTTPGSILCVRGDNLALAFDPVIKGQQLIVTNYTSVGGGGAEGTTTMSVISRVFCNNTSDTHAPYTMATYSTNGLRGLKTSKYLAGGNLDAATANDNVSITTGVTPLITSDKTINSLQVYQYKTANIGSGRTLTIQSGQLVMQHKTTLGAVNNSNAGTLNFGETEGDIHVGGLSKLTIKENVADAIDNSYSLYIKDDYNTSQIVLETGINEEVENLYINGVAQERGTYGSTTSAATYQNDNIFSGDGIITVPPPGTVLIVQ